MLPEFFNGLKEYTATGSTCRRSACRACNIASTPCSSTRASSTVASMRSLVSLLPTVLSTFDTCGKTSKKAQSGHHLPSGQQNLLPLLGRLLIDGLQVLYKKQHNIAFDTRQHLSTSHLDKCIVGNRKQ
ncbi:hypothetical protein pipiens_015103 [Culex pipiens pipiens]|uniref:Uncharacterized protein n=1 Tax=Culex pipiens pipiens TaxID=38569 RepID=A0ABD1CRW3_CULPP